MKTLIEIRDILRNAGRFDIFGTNEQACDLADAIDAHLSAQAKVRVIPRRPLDDDHPDGYRESDRDYVLNNVESAVILLDSEIKSFAARLSQGAQGEALPEYLKDPVNVHALMLRGAVAIPSIRSMVDLRGEVPNGEDAQLARIAELQEQLAERAAVPDGVQHALDYLHTFVTSSHNTGWQKNREMWDIVRRAALTAAPQPPEGALTKLQTQYDELRTAHLELLARLSQADEQRRDSKLGQDDHAKPEDGAVLMSQGACATCHGGGVVRKDGFFGPHYKPCPDCTD